MSTEIGIASIGYYIPSKILTSQEIAQLSNIPVSVFTEKIGMHKKHIADIDEHPTDMGVKAATTAIEKLRVAPEEIDIIAYCGASHYDYSFWSPAAKIQHKIGAKNAFAFEVGNFCNGGNLGIHICSSMLLNSPNLRYAIVICSEKLSMLLNYADKDSLSTFIMADGAAAVILKKGETTNQVLSYCAVTDGQLVDHVKVPLGGTKFPINSDSFDQKLSYLSVENPRGLAKRLSDIYLNNYINVISKAVNTSGYSIDEIDFLFISQIKKDAFISILSSLGLAEENTFSSLSEYGHMGSVDTLFCLAKSLEAKKIKQGSLVVLASSAVGFSWAATVLKY